MKDRLMVEGLLGPAGVLSEVLPGYESRPQQLAMAQAVEKCFAEHGYLLAEAGTGTGKTFAYLVPAVLSGRKVVISTATKTLQEQIFLKDIPILKQQVGLQFEAAYLKGRNNYLCLHRFEEMLQQPEFAIREEAKYWPRIQQWAARTEVGDRAELDLPDSFSAWRELSTTPETCLGTVCPQYEPCFVTRSRRWAEQADLVVVNHHLFFADLAIRSSQGTRGEGVLPHYDAVVFDEAHALEEVATDYFGRQISNRRMEDLASDAIRADGSGEHRVGALSAVANRIREQSEALFHALPHALSLPSGDGSYRLEAKNLEPLDGHFDALLQSLTAAGALGSSSDQPELIAVSRRAVELAADLEFIWKARAMDHVYWVERRGRGVFLRAAPIDIGGELRRRLYPSVDTLVFTSATLTVSGRFDYFSRRIGLSEDQPPLSPLARISVDSPFDFRRQAALYVPARLPDPNSPEFPRAVADEIVRLVQITGGRAFALFTSLRNMAAVHQLVKPRVPFTVLLQGERPKSALLELFRQGPSVLFAAQSFWEGVDVPGNALSLVIIDRLPFASPGDPLVAARIEQLRKQGEDPFSAYQLPQAAIALRQGFGRLIRTQQDRGVVAILDHRIRTRPYGTVFLDSLPPVPRFGELSSLENWFVREGNAARPA